jgi:hypothetical protein
MRDKSRDIVFTTSTGLPDVFIPLDQFVDFRARIERALELHDGDAKCGTFARAVFDALIDSPE